MMEVLADAMLVITLQYQCDTVSHSGQCILTDTLQVGYSKGWCLGGVRGLSLNEEV